MTYHQQEALKIAKEAWHDKTTETLTNELRGSNNVLRQALFLTILAERHGLDFDTGIGRNGMYACRPSWP